MGTRGQNVKKKKKNSLCQPADARMWPVTTAWVMAGHSTCGARVMISDAKADSDHAVVAWQVYLDGWWQVVELMNTSFFFPCRDIMSFCVSALGTAPKLHHCNKLKIREVNLWLTSFFHCQFTRQIQAVFTNSTSSIKHRGWLNAHTILTLTVEWKPFKRESCGMLQLTEEQWR